MENKPKGITVEIVADASGLETALDKSIEKAEKLNSLLRETESTDNAICFDGLVQTATRALERELKKEPVSSERVATLTNTIQVLSAITPRRLH